MIPEEVYEEALKALGEVVVRERLLTRIVAERDEQIAVLDARIAALEDGAPT